MTLFAELEGVTPGHAPYTLALHALMGRLTAAAPGAEQQRLMSDWNALRGTHLDALERTVRQDHAQVLTPVITVGTLELSSLLLGVGLGLMVFVIAQTLHADLTSAPMLLIGVATVVSAGLNRVLVQSRATAFGRMRLSAEQDQAGGRNAGRPESAGPGEHGQHA